MTSTKDMGGPVYTAEVYTTDEKEWKRTGTDNNVYLSLRGVHGVTERVLLDKRWHDDLEAGSRELYQINGGDVGDLLYMTLEREGQDDWRLDKVIITNNVTNVTTPFPVYAWIEAVMRIRPGNALLPFQEISDETRKLRKEEIKRQKEVYRYKEGNATRPGYIEIEAHENLPKFVRFFDAKQYDIQHNFDVAKKKFGISTLIEKLHTWDKPEHVAHIGMRFTSGEDLEFQQFYLEKWDDDVVFGTMVLNGPNPVMIRRCSKLPENFPVTSDMVNKSLQRNLALEAEMKEGHVYILNYEDLVGLGRFRKGEDVRHCANAIVLLYVRPSGHLVPIAIKLDQDDGPIWTPEDGLGWTMAKMYAKNADVQIHQMGSHLMGTHLVMEAVIMATLRNLSSVHPIYKLLLPHTRLTIAINTLARAKLVGPGGVVDKTFSVSGDGNHIKLVERCYRKRFQWNNLNIPNELASRGVEDAKLLPNYHYRDDALLLWDAILEYARQMVAIYYTSDRDVIADDELQNFMKELHLEGFPSAEGDLDKQCPDSVRTVSDLTTTMAMIIFTCSCQHAAVNFGQFHHMSNPLAYPLALREPPPQHKRNFLVEDIMAALPDEMLTVAAVGMTYALTRYSDTEVYLGDFPEELFVEDAAKVAQAKFRQNLGDISTKIKARNDGREFKYLYLLPERVPSSIAA